MRLERIGKVGDPLLLVLSVECDHCPIVRVFSQFWILDKTGFGCRFTDGFLDLLNTIPDGETSRRSHLLVDETRDTEFRKDMSLPGHQWSMGKSGMSLFFSRREKLSLCIERGAGSGRFLRTAVRSRWVAPLDISNVMPKTVFSVDELAGTKRFELAIHVTVCPGLFGRTKLVKLLPRYQIVNLLRRELVIAQDGCLKTETVIPSQSSVPFHLEKGSLAPRVRLGAPSREERDGKRYDQCWSKGGFQLDRIGITSMRLPTQEREDIATGPLVVQAEVRLASKDQSSAVVLVVWSANQQSNPLYILRNSTSRTVLCRQPLRPDRVTGRQSMDDDFVEKVGCTGTLYPSTRNFHCTNDSLFSMLGIDQSEEFVWVLKPGQISCFGFDDPERPHAIEWMSADAQSENTTIPNNAATALLEVNTMGSTSSLTYAVGRQIVCQIRAEHSTKVVEFSESQTRRRLSRSYSLDTIRPRSAKLTELLESELSPTRRPSDDQVNLQEEDDDVAFSLVVELPTLSVSVIDNLLPSAHGREILLAELDQLGLSFSQTREGYHEFELRLKSFQVDNHVHKSIHPVLVRSFVKAASLARVVSCFPGI